MKHPISLDYLFIFSIICCFVHQFILLFVYSFIWLVFLLPQFLHSLKYFTPCINSRTWPNLISVQEEQFLMYPNCFELATPRYLLSLWWNCSVFNNKPHKLFIFILVNSKKTWEIPSWHVFVSSLKEKWTGHLHIFSCSFNIFVRLLTCQLT